MNRLNFDLKTRLPVLERPDREPCGICKRQVSRYTCPTCNLPYCSLTCFKSETHSKCSETFYRREIEEDIKTAPAKSAEERHKMLQLLRKFEEGSARDADDLAEEQGDDDELAHKLEGVNLDEVDPHAIWELLSAAQRDSFLKAMRDPSSELAQELLSSTELEQAQRKPWWESPSLDMDEASPDSTNEFGAPPQIMSIPKTLGALESASESHRSLVYNVLAFCLAYAYVTRRLSTSPLSSLQPTDSDHAVAQDLLSRTAPFLTDRKSTMLFTDVDSLVTYLWSRLESLSDPPSNKSFSVLLADAGYLFRPKPVSVINEGDSDSQPSPSRMVLLAISDTAELFGSAPSGLKHVLHKLNFYAAYICAQNNDVLRLVADEARFAGLKMESQSPV